MCVLHTFLSRLIMSSIGYNWFISYLITSLQYFRCISRLNPPIVNLSHLYTGAFGHLLNTCSNHLRLIFRILSSTKATLIFCRMTSFLIIPVLLVSAHNLVNGVLTKPRKEKKKKIDFHLNIFIWMSLRIRLTMIFFLLLY